MKQLATVLLIFIAVVQLAAQVPDTVRPRKQIFEIGLNVTNTISSFIGSTGSNIANDPYLIVIRSGTDRCRFRMGLNFRVKNLTDPNFSGDLTEKESNFNLRMGCEWVAPVSKRLGMYYGLDGVFNRRKEEVKSSSLGGQAVLIDKAAGFGVGPVLGIVWRIHPRVALTTESSVYAIYQKGTEQVNAPPDFSKKETESFVWQPLAPTSLYINFLF